MDVHAPIELNDERMQLAIERRVVAPYLKWLEDNGLRVFANQYRSVGTHQYNLFDYINRILEGTELETAFRRWQLNHLRNSTKICIEGEVIKN